MIINCQPCIQPCIASQLCFPYFPFKLSSYDLTKLENIIVRNPPLQKGELLFQCGDRLTALYVIRSGVIKSYKVTSGSGKKQITAFYSMGDVLGLDAINNLCYSTSTKALDTSMVCAIPFEPLERLSNQIPSLRRQLLQLMSRHIQDVQENLSIVKKSAKARLAAFIYKSISNRCRYGFSPSILHLPMSRTDISNYLGVSLETVSRLFNNLQRCGIITTKGRYVTIHDNDKLARLAQYENFII
ncbi:MAG: fumarate/nitrate reduction transcriptional regulator Fnr [Candidatus Symbiodolus clandestinus]